MNLNPRSENRNLLSAVKFHRGFLVIFLLSAFLFFVNLGAYKKFERAEGYFSLGSKMLVETGDFLLMHSLQEMPLNKPPLQYWVIAAAYELFGTGYGSGRIPAALCALAILALVYFFGLRFFEKTVVLTATAMTGSVWMFIGFARMAMPDLMLTLLVGAALGGWILVLTDKTKHARFFALAGYAFVALAFLTKGPIALVLAFAPVTLELLIARDFAGLKKLLPFSGALVFLLVAAPYFLLVYLYHGVEPLHTFFIVENLERFTGAGEYRSRTSSLQYPLTAFLGGFAPWSLLTLLAAVLDFKYRKRIEQLKVLRVLYLWMIFPLAFFCISRFKLDYYLLPIIPALSLITARLVSKDYLSIGWVKNFLVIFAGATALILTIGLAAGIYFLAELLAGTPLLYLPVFPAAAVPVLIVFCFKTNRTQYILPALALQIWLIFSYLCLVFMPAFARFQPSWTLAGKIPAEARVYCYKEAGGWIPNLAFQLPSSQFIKEFGSVPTDAELADLFQKDSRAILMIYENDFLTLDNSRLQLQILAEENVYPASNLSLKFINNSRQEKLLIVARRK